MIEGNENFAIKRSYKRGIFLIFFFFCTCIHHCFICHPSDSLCRRMLGSNQGVTKRCRPSMLTNNALAIRVQMRGQGGICGVSDNEYRCTHHVTCSPNKLWRSTSIFNLWIEPRSAATLALTALTTRLDLIHTRLIDLIHIQLDLIRDKIYIVLSHPMRGEGFWMPDPLAAWSVAWVH
jgi:hypothetical protein